MKSNFELGQEIGRQFVDQMEPLTEVDDDVKFSEGEKKLATKLVNEAVEKKMSSEKIFSLGVAFGKAGTRLLTEETDIDDESMRVLIEETGNRRGSFRAWKRVVGAEIKKQYGPSARVVATFPDSVLFEWGEEHFKVDYSLGEGSIKLGQSTRMKGTLQEISEQLNSERKRWLFDLKVAGINKPVRFPSHSIDEAKLTRRQKKDLSIAGLLPNPGSG